MTSTRPQGYYGPAVPQIADAVRTDPPVSEAQRRLMRAAAAGEVEGVSKSVGREFSQADPGGKLPEHKKSDSQPDTNAFGRGEIRLGRGDAWAAPNTNAFGKGLSPSEAVNRHLSFHQSWHRG